MIECNLCGGEWPPARPDREIERCPWCLNPIEGEMEQVGEDWKDRSAVVRAAKSPTLLFQCSDRRVGDCGVEVDNGAKPRRVWLDMTNRFRPFTPLEAHRLARWILGNVDLADGELP